MGVGIYRWEKLRALQGCSEKQHMFGTIGAYVWYYWSICLVLLTQWLKDYFVLLGK
jgi:hypothetical protein